MATSKFGKAFAAARKEKGAGKTFTFEGKSYSTNMASDKSSAPTSSPRPTARPAKKAPPMKGRPDSAPRVSDATTVDRRWADANAKPKAEAAKPKTEVKTPTSSTTRPQARPTSAPKSSPRPTARPTSAPKTSPRPTARPQHIGMTAVNNLSSGSSNAPRATSDAAPKGRTAPARATRPAATDRDFTSPTPSSFPTYMQWRKKNAGGIVAYNAAKDRQTGR